MKALIVYYSRTGTTRKIAEAIKNSLDGDIDEIQDAESRSGIFGWLKAGRDAGSKSLTRIENVDYNPSDYDVVVIGSPTWNGTVSTPIRTYITEYKDKLQDIALFSSGYSREPDAFEEMDMLLGGKSIATLHLHKKQEIENRKSTAQDKIRKKRNRGKNNFLPFL